VFDIKKKEECKMINKVDSSAMRNAGREIEQMAVDYTQQVTQLYQVGQELDAYWKGDAKKTFDAQLGQDQPKFDALNNVVRQYVEALFNASTEYDKAEERAQEILNS
jgi:WXG100 family type VII secretion target